ncbi:MAG: phosphoribosylformylglycinamidine synthase I [Flavobacteriales bacterium]|jgi:phosphoribosylformylglycinamidine synthase subunit PurQ / glutaminase|nr:phosphoribosylformylglycinamidine synthase I [Flavobacteriales bacterium]MBT5089772.1 phosphoribosylformylglycinamidine synthase I [Flavobacteriales bacterium]MBT5750263.1 phosphoribosylformylglycinamidine synthase I [Flavobacteriales bacterium]
MKFGVVVFPGSNCDMDMVYVLENIMKQEVVKLWHKNTDLQECDFIILPGGFSFGDYLRSGAIAKFSPIMTEIIGFANAGGYVMGICNGFQILTESGLLPGALLHNDSHKFICKNIYLKVETKNTLVTNQYAEKAIQIPIAHGEGKYFADEKTMKSLIQNDQILFKYCDANGNITEQANPNGSLLNIAGICNADRNIFGMMPHPERAADKELNNQDGFTLFKSILAEILL